MTGGRILTMDPSRPEARSILVRDGRIAEVSDLDDSFGVVGSDTCVFDLDGGCATPGLVDAHGHPDHLGEILDSVDLRDARSIDDVVERLRAESPPDGWVIGRNWNHTRWDPPTPPDHRALTAAFPDRPVWLLRVDLHAVWGNARLLTEAGIERTTSDPRAGRIERGPSGEPTGLLIDRAMDLAKPPAAGPGDVEHGLLRAQDHLLDRGVTGVHHMGVDAETDRAYRKLNAAGDGARGLDLRIHGYARSSLFEERAEAGPDPTGRRGRYALAGVKLFADGALGSHGALLDEDYSDRAGERGLELDGPETVERITTTALRRGWQVAAHAIGDRAVRRVLDAFSRARDRIPVAKARLRIEHASVVHPADVARMRRGRVIASVQPSFAMSDRAWITKRLGPRRTDWAYAFRRMLSAGVPLALGSDFPVELADPRIGLQAAVTRQDLSGRPAGEWQRRDVLTLTEALRGFTVGAAFAAGCDTYLGKIREGFEADITCFGEDLETVPRGRLSDVPILATIVGGRVVGPRLR